MLPLYIVLLVLCSLVRFFLCVELEPTLMLGTLVVVLPCTCPWSVEEDARSPFYFLFFLKQLVETAEAVHWTLAPVVWHET